VNLRRLFHWLVDRHRDGSMTQAPLDEEPPVVRNWGEAVARPRRMDEPRPRDVGGLTWEKDAD
jgi:hypothetical protein